jgi:hypothetical protein
MPKQPKNQLKILNYCEEIVQYIVFVYVTNRKIYTVLFTFQLCNGSRELRHKHRQQREQQQQQQQ